MDVKANSDVKHAKSQLAAENKKKKTLEKSLTDVCIYVLYHTVKNFKKIFSYMCKKSFCLSFRVKISKILCITVSILYTLNPKICCIFPSGSETINIKRIGNEENVGCSCGITKEK